jgi:hypothetical protein
VDPPTWPPSAPLPRPLKDVGYLHIAEGRRDHTTPAETLRLHGLDKRTDMDIHGTRRSPVSAPRHFLAFQCVPKRNKRELIVFQPPVLSLVEATIAVLVEPD